MRWHETPEWNGWHLQNFSADTSGQTGRAATMGGHVAVAADRRILADQIRALPAMDFALAEFLNRDDVLALIEAAS